MAQIVREAMDAGAVGFASSTSPAHNGEGGMPMPSRLASDAEMMALIRAMGEAGRGVYMVTKGGQMPVPFLEDMSAQSGRPVMIAALLHNSTNPHAVFKDLDAISRRQRPRPPADRPGVVLPADDGLHARLALPGGRPAELEAGARSRRARRSRPCCATPSSASGVRDEMAAPTTFRLFNGEWDKVQVVEVAQPAHTRYEQRTVADIAAEERRDPLDVMLDLALAEDLQTVFTAQLLNSDEEAVGRMLNHPHSIVSLSDAGAHLTFFNDAGFGLHLMGHWSRELGVMSMSDAVRRLTIATGGGVRHDRPRLHPRRHGGRPAAVRPRHRGARPQAAGVRPARRRATPDHRRRGRARRVGQRPTGGRCRWASGGRAAGRPIAHRICGIIMGCTLHDIC